MAWLKARPDLGIGPRSAAGKIRGAGPATHRKPGAWRLSNGSGPKRDYGRGVVPLVTEVGLWPGAWVTRQARNRSKAMLAPGLSSCAPANGYIAPPKSPRDGRRDGLADLAQARLRVRPSPRRRLLLRLGLRVQRVLRLRELHGDGHPRVHGALRHVPLPRA